MHDTLWVGKNGKAKFKFLEESDRDDRNAAQVSELVWGKEKCHSLETIYKAVKANPMKRLERRPSFSREMNVDWRAFQKCEIMAPIFEVASRQSLLLLGSLSGLDLATHAVSTRTEERKDNETRSNRRREGRALN